MHNNKKKEKIIIYINRKIDNIAERKLGILKILSIFYFFV